jgi:hypothetical protein
MDLNPLNWIRRRAWNRERAIFRYWDGARWRWIDPFLAFRRLADHPEFDWEKDPALIDFADQRTASGCADRTVRAVREVFGIPAFDGSRGTPAGLTEAELIALLVAFTAYVTDAKKNTGPPATSSPPTEPRPSEASTITPASACT